MKRLLIYNYWLIIIAWCLFLNGLTLLAIILGLLACLLLAQFKRKVNYWRLAFVSVILYLVISFFLQMSNIPYYFEKLYIFFAIVCLDLAYTNERVYLFKSKYLKPILAVMIISVSVLSIAIAFLPDNLYTIFTKESLYIMIGVIFLPSIFELSICICLKNLIKPIKRKEKIFKMLQDYQNSINSSKINHTV